MTLLVDVNCPGCQEDLVSNWEPALSLVEDAVSGAEIAPCLLVLPIARLLSVSSRGEGPVHSLLTLLWYSLEPLFCVTRLCLRAFLGKVLSLSLSFFFSLSLAIPQFGLLSHISSLRLSSGHSGLVPTLSRQPAPPCPAPVHCWRTQVSRLPLCWKSQLAHNLWVLFFPSRLCFPPRFQNSPQTHQ